MMLCLRQQRYVPATRDRAVLGWLNNEVQSRCWKHRSLSLPVTLPIMFLVSAVATPVIGIAVWVGLKN
jgi:hypothetical protein